MYSKSHFFGSQDAARQLSNVRIADAVEAFRKLTTNLEHLTKMVAMNPALPNKDATEILTTCRDVVRPIVKSATTLTEDVKTDQATAEKETGYSSDYRIGL